MKVTDALNLLDQEEIAQWSEKQDFVRVSAIKINEETKYIYTIGEFVATPHIFDTQEEALEYLEKNFKLTNMDLAIIGTLCQRISKIYSQLKKEEK